MSSAGSSATAVPGAAATGGGGYVASSNSKAARAPEVGSRSADRANKRPTFPEVERDEAAAKDREKAAETSGTALAAAGTSAALVPSGGSTPSPSAGPGAAGGGAVPMNNYAFFVKYTYSNECALLAYNFHEMVTSLGLFEYFTYRHDHRLISVTLAYIFYRYQVHHCDMALDLAVTLVYLEDVRAAYQPELHEHNKDAFNLICYLAFLAHAFNADRTIRLSDWYKEIGWRSFRNCQQLNGYVFFLFSQVRRFRLRVSETRVKRYIRKLCSVPSQIHNET